MHLDNKKNGRHLGYTGTGIFDIKWGTMETASDQIKIISFDQGTRIFRQGDDLSKAYILQKGKVELSKNVDGHESVVISVVGRGGVIGDASVVDLQPAAVTARAITPVTAMVVQRSEFQRLLKSSHPLIRNMMLSMSSTMRDHMDRVVDNAKVVY